MLTTTTVFGLAATHARDQLVLRAGEVHGGAVAALGLPVVVGADDHDDRVGVACAVATARSSRSGGDGCRSPSFMPRRKKPSCPTNSTTSSTGSTGDELDRRLDLGAPDPEEPVAGAGRIGDAVEHDHTVDAARGRCPRIWMSVNVCVPVSSGV